MSRRQADRVFCHLRSYLAAERAGELADGDLLRRFAASHDEAAFAALVRRYGPLVMGVCRRVLRHEQDAEDAFQATFLVLVRRAGALDGRGTLASYLHTVAYRAALKARMAFRRRNAAAPLEDVVAPRQDSDLERRELCGVLDEEISRLPEKYRAPLLLCDVQGKTHGEAGRELGQPAGSMSRLVGRGRELLRERLRGRGLALPAGGLSVLLASAARAAPGVAQAVAASAWKEATCSRAGAIADAVLAEMAWQPLKAASVLALAAGLLGLGLVAAQPREGPPRAAATDSSPKGGAVVGAESPLPPQALARLGTSRFRHAVVAAQVVWMPDGKTIVSGSHLGTIRVWDAATGKELRAFRAHDGGVCSLAVSPDGRRLASGSWDCTIRLWDTSTWARLPWAKVGHANGGEVCALAFSPDGKALACGLKNGFAILADSATGMRQRLLSAHVGEARCVAFSPDGKRLATCGDDKLVRVWDVESGAEQLRCAGHTARVNGVAFSPDGQQIASCGRDQTARLWDLAGKELRSLRQVGWPERLAFSPDGKSLAVACGWGGEVRVWDLTGKKDTLRWRGWQPQSEKVAFSPDGKKLAGSGWEATVRVWDVASGKEEGAASAPGHTGWVYAVVPAHDPRVVFSAGSDWKVMAWDVLTGKPLWRAEEHGARVNCLALSPDGATLASGGRDGKVHLRDARTGRLLGSFQPGGSVKSLAFSPDGRLVATASGNDLYDGWVPEIPGHGATVWDVATRSRLVRLVGHAGGVNAVAFSPDGKLLATAGNDRTVRFWNPGTGTPLRQLPAQPGAVECLAFSPDGTRLAVGGQSGSQDFPRLFDVASGALLHGFTFPNQWIMRLAFSPDGRTLLTASWQGGAPLRLWDVATGKERARFVGHQGTAFGVSFSRDGRTAISGGGDSTVLIWDVTGRMEGGRLAALDLSPAELRAAWADLADDGAKAHRAVWKLVAAKQAVPLLRERLKPAAAADRKRIERLLKELDDDAFTTREKASEELRAMGSAIVPALKKASEASPSAEVRVRARRLLEVLDGKGAREQALRQARGVEVLEHIGDADARRLLQALAGGAADAPLTAEAKSALRRLASARRAP
jgi:RNA polymerase sigma factor (sigma-70 family)